MDKFLNSFAFEQMVREYNNKYGNNQIKALTILNEDVFAQEVANIFNRVSCLFDALKNFFGLNLRLKSFFIDVENLKEEFKQVYKNLFLKEYEEDFLNSKHNINHKYCSIEMLDVLKSIYKFQNMFIDKTFLNNKSDIDKEKDVFLFKDLQKTFEKIINSFKDFYVKI